MKVIKDFKDYLTGIEKLSKRLNPSQKRDLERILSSLLTLLVGFKKGSHLGEVFINWKN